ncbi:UNVERIFIED_CONTAM: hypothetical protein FKN15_052920 [Acipenser sinensis]
MAKESQKRNVFTKTEIEILVNEAEANKSPLFSKLKTNVTNQAKISKWANIAQKMNASNTGAPREGKDVCKKWQDFASLAKRKAADIKKQQQKTGGGQCSITLTAEEDKAVNVMGPTAVNGIPGGIKVLGQEFPADVDVSQEERSTRSALLETITFNSNTKCLVFNHLTTPTVQKCSLMINKMRIHLKEKKKLIQLYNGYQSPLTLDLTLIS